MTFDYNEADTCRLYVTPKLRDAGWETSPSSITEQRTFTDGRIVVANGKSKRGEGKRTDYILRYRRDFPIAVGGAKAYRESTATGLQQAKEYAEILGFKFAYATNGREIIEFDYLTGSQRELDQFPTSQELWARLSGADRKLPRISSNHTSVNRVKRRAIIKRSRSTGRCRRWCRDGGVSITISN